MRRSLKLFVKQVLKKPRTYVYLDFEMCGINIPDKQLDILSLKGYDTQMHLYRRGVKTAHHWDTNYDLKTLSLITGQDETRIARFDAQNMGKSLISKKLLDTYILSELMKAMNIRIDIDAANKFKAEYLKQEL